MQGATTRDTTKKTGFTLIELMVVIVIAGILVTLGVFSMQHLAREGRVEAGGRQMQRAIYRARAGSMRRDKPFLFVFNTALPEADTMKWGGNVNVTTSESHTRYWLPGAVPLHTNYTSATGPTLYSDDPADQWYAIIGPAPVYSDDPLLGGRAIDWRSADAERSPEEGWVKNNAHRKRRDLYNTEAGEWDPWSIQVGPRHYLPDHCRFWNSLDIADYHDSEEAGNVLDEEHAHHMRSSMLGTWPDAVCAARMAGVSEVKDKGTGGANVVVYPRGTFGLNQAAAYAGRGGQKESALYFGVVDRFDNFTRRIVNLNPITGHVTVTRKWDMALSN